jgi:putative DNA primase/helicase
VEIVELRAFQKRSAESKKAFLSARFDKYTPHYAIAEIERPRRCVFVGTTNSDDYLDDYSGARRFWPVVTTTIDIAAVKRDRDQLWAESVVRFKSGETWHLTPADYPHATEEQEARYEGDSIEDMISEALEHGVRNIIGAAPGTWAIPPKVDKIRISEVASKILKVDVPDRSLQMRIANSLKRLGWKKKCGYKYNFWVRPLEAEAQKEARLEQISRASDEARDILARYQERVRSEAELGRAALHDLTRQ